MELFLSDLAVNGRVAAWKQNRARNPVLLLEREVLPQGIENVRTVRARGQRGCLC